MLDSLKNERSGFKQSVSRKFTLQEIGCLEPVSNLYNSLSVFIALGIQHAEKNGFKQSVSCKRTLHEAGCLELVPLLYKLLQWKNTKYSFSESVFIALGIRHA
jgi:hypothetical protein